ncbi:splicing factor [Striga asiatica]|uniref:Splicing factor n=1 Tax=Striga asiatica TaxID=4170 RepID=A0A5A7R8A6_STRAF|nr:splicing factor [Striga asiatica]
MLPHLSQSFPAPNSFEADKDFYKNLFRIIFLRNRSPTAKIKVLHNKRIHIYILSKSGLTNASHANNGDNLTTRLLSSQLIQGFKQDIIETHHGTLGGSGRLSSVTGYNHIQAPTRHLPSLPTSLWATWKKRPYTRAQSSSRSSTKEQSKTGFYQILNFEHEVREDVRSGVVRVERDISIGLGLSSAGEEDNIRDRCHQKKWR